MTKRSLVPILILLLIATASLAQRAVPARPAAAPPQGMSTDRQAALLKQYCIGCHNDKTTSGAVNLAAVDLTKPDQHGEVIEKMIRKIRAGMMPPPAAPRPDRDTLMSLAGTLESAMDRVAAVRPNLGNRHLQRLNRVEYANSIRELLGIDVDVAALLPPDSMGRGFDNIADVLTLSPSLMEGYVRAAAKITRVALGDLNAAPATTTYNLPRTASQMRHVEGTPFGTRGGLSVVSNFPADGEYVFRVEPFDDSNGNLVGAKAEGEQIEISINGERVALLDIDSKMTVTRGGVFVQSAPIRVKAGSQRVAAAFIERFSGPV